MNSIVGIKIRRGSTAAFVSKEIGQRSKFSFELPSAFHSFSFSSTISINNFSVSIRETLHYRAGRDPLRAEPVYLWAVN